MNVFLITNHMCYIILNDILKTITTVYNSDCDDSTGVELT